MDAKTYFSKLNTAAQKTFATSAEDQDFLGSIHDCSISLQEWADVLKDEFSIELIKHCYEQIEISGFSILLGLYRQAFAGLRLSLEMVFAGIYFSSNKIEFIEWNKTNKNLSWSIISGTRSEDDDPQRGVLSNRFISAFSPELISYASEYQKRGKILYKELSGFVHGESNTWDLNNPTLTYESQIIERYKSSLKEFKFLTQIAFCIRFLKELSDDNKNRLETQISDELKHIEEIRVILGGPTSF